MRRALQARAGLCATLGLLLAGWAWAQAPQAAPDDTAERARIATERVAIAERFAAEERACHQRFAVNDCLENNLRWQRGALGELRRQEVLLNDAQRQYNAAERIRRLDEKQQAHDADQAGRPAAAPRTPNAPAGPVGGKLPQSGEPAPRTPDTAKIEQHQETMRRKQDQHAQDQARRATQAAGADAEARRQDKRLREAADHKARILERNTANPSAAKPLPAPAP